MTTDLFLSVPRTSTPQSSIHRAIGSLLDTEEARESTQLGLLPA